MEVKELANHQKNHETFHLIIKILTFMSLCHTDGQDIYRIDAQINRLLS